MPDTRARATTERTATYVSLPNPQTPFSPNESGPVNYAQEMRERAQHVASVTQARVNVARIESERLAAIERERVEAIERERLASAQTSPSGEAGMSSAPVGSTSAAAGGSSAAITAPVENSSTSTAPAPVPAPQREAQADPNAALVDTRSMLGAGTAPQESNVVGSAPASSEANANPSINTEARRPDETAASAGMSGSGASINASSTVAGGGTDAGNTPRENARLMLQEGNTDTTPR